MNIFEEILNGNVSRNNKPKNMFCPFMSTNSEMVYYREDCALYHNSDTKCSIKVLINIVSTISLVTRLKVDLE
jgi:hypothetical protein